MTEAGGKGGHRSGSSNGEGGVNFPYQQYLEQRDGQPYLPLKWRMAWLRADHPQAKIKTKLASHEGNVAVFMARVELPEGGVATGWGAKSRQETLPGPFDSEGLDYLIAAENQALSRALAALGYGTEYALDFDPPAENQAIPLPEGAHFTEAPDEEEPGIEVPLDEPAPTPIRRPAAPPTQAALPPTPSAEEPDEEEEDEEDEEEVDFPGRPLPVTPPKGEVRPLFGNRPTPVTSQVRETPEKRPVRLPDRQPVEEPPEFGAGASSGASRNVPSEPVVKAAPTPGNPAVDERLKNVRDDALRVKIKRVYQIARERFKYDEDRVDTRSRQIYKKPTFELDAEQADDYYERIVSAPQPKQR
ncbi:MAG: hypothetical protein J0I20_00115 [Chloroflexi bacterium]|nr:hypothetical protein [Chloroflexota bacterium]OJW03219.1 MAG: hypothetical protein BGO39_08730 [Chloroflexi bacterium 54-19]